MSTRAPSSKRRRAIVRSGLADQVYGALKEQILDMEHSPGERLVIDQIAREMGVSGTPVRDALTRLAAERLIDFAPFRGYTVLPEPTLDEIAQSFEARQAIEIVAVRLGCKRAEDKEIEQLAALHERISSHSYGARSGSFSQFVKLNQDFHELLVRTSRNQYLVGALRGLYHDVLIARTMHGRGVPDLEHIDEEHRAIIEALRRRDADAVEAALARHIGDGATRVLAARGASAA
jgi:DNA-binding GntR family transcriptional regulator